MNIRSSLLPTALLLFALAVAPPCRSNVVTFDDLALNTYHASLITNEYQGLVWSNFWGSNAILFTQTYGPNGYYNGMVSASNVVFNGYARPAEIDSSTNFDFLSVYLTGAFNSNLNIEVEGFRAGTLLYGTTVVASATSPTLFTFDYLDVDRLYFSASGGEDAGFPVSQGAGDAHFVMDNFEFEFIPEPSTFLLAALGGVSLIAFLRRKRV